MVFGMYVCVGMFVDEKGVYVICWWFNLLLNFDNILFVLLSFFVIVIRDGWFFVAF